MTPRLRAALVHVLTASGAAIALLALLAAAAGDWERMFIWLGVAFLIDGLDGPLARYLRVGDVLPRWSGENLDLMVDYLTYVAVPAFALTQADLLPEELRLPAAIAVLLAGLFHMSDTQSKTEAGYFVGFPAIWNVVLFYLFALQPSPLVSLLIVLVCVVLTFLPVLSVHPIRVTAMRPATLVALGLWSMAAIVAVLDHFPAPFWAQVLLIGTGVWFIGISAFASLKKSGAA
jgi:phosphatidylcholine synthase